MRISLIQTDIVWEDKTQNLSQLENKLAGLRQTTDLAVLPEMFTTGFSMNSHALAETMDGETIATLKQWSKKFGFAITGSFICSEAGSYYNRAIFITPQGEIRHYDKHHLFRMSQEPQHFRSGKEKCIFTYMGWNICLNICYDLRFPVWLRNRSNEYDLLIFVANWPIPRRNAWETLLCARALENQAYVCGVNRIGIDGNGLKYSGQSLVFNAKGERIVEFEDNEECIQTINLDKDALLSFRAKFPVWQDSDDFLLY